MSGDSPRYRRYRARTSRGDAGAPDPLRELRDFRRDDAAQAIGDPRVPAGAKPGAGDGDGGRSRLKLRPRRRVRIRKPITAGRVARWAAAAIGAWILLGLVVFLISAQVHQVSVPSSISGGGTPPFGTSTILVLGSDTRPSGSKEPGARTKGYGLADSIMLLRVGGGHNRRLSIARDTMVPIPGYGVGKINSAYAYGGPKLMAQTIQNYLGVKVNHVMQINFTSFPGLINAMGGINYKGACVDSKISGGYKNGGVTLHIHSGKKVHLNGQQALALARTRKNACNPGENDLTRARRQQRVISSMKSRALSPIGFLRLPLIAWELPKTLSTDMAGPRLMGVMAAMMLGSGGKPQVLGTESGVVPDSMKTSAVQKLMG
jgi:LCP family protein required for cell wall assembly